MQNITKEIIIEKLNENRKEYEGYYALKNRGEDLMKLADILLNVIDGFEEDEILTCMEVIRDNIYNEGYEEPLEDMIM